MKRKIKINLQVIIEYLLAITIVFNCNSVYAAALKDYHLNEIAAILTGVLVATGVVKGGANKRLVNKWLGLFSVYYVLMLAYMIASVPGESILGFVSRFIIFIPFMALYLSMLAKKNQQNRLLTALINVMVALSVISVFFWFFGSLLHILHPNMSIEAHWGRDFTFPGYFGVYFERQTINLFSFSGYRNDGIFTEGPMHSLCLVVALAALFLMDDYSFKGRLKKASRRKAAVLIVALVTVMSLTGYAMLAGLFFYRFITAKSRNRASLGFRVIVAAFIIVIGGLAVAALFVEKQQTSSWLIRLDDLQAGMKAWLAAPIFGNGYGSYAVEKYMSAFRWWNTGFSSALLSVLSQGGLVLFSVYLFAFIFGFKNAIKARNKSMVAFVGVILLELIVTTVHFTFLILFLLAYCYMLQIQPSAAKKRAAVRTMESQEPTGETEHTVWRKHER